jgi:hypothetical protein
MILNAVQFKTYAQYEVGQRVGIVYTVNVNHFRGESTVQLMVERIV